MDIKELKNKFVLTYGESEEIIHVYFAPGRVNLIGEHTDYNGGFVFPCALSFGTYVACRFSKDNNFKFSSLDFPETRTVSLDHISEIIKGNWTNYPVGVINQFLKKGLTVRGIEFLFHGDVPNKAGLSSSASIEVSTAVAVNDMMNFNVNKIELSKMSQRAEIEFADVNCGIMDQFVSCNGAKEKAVALNCDTLEYELVPVELGDYKLVITNTNKSRGLADSKYNERRGECDEAVRLLSKGKPIKYLCELSNEEFESSKHLIKDETILKRARHAISENQRVFRAVDSLKNGNLEVFGKLMNDSHDSLRYDYEVTGFELDTLVEESRKIKGVLGSRMTGAGFGGCIVSLVHKDSVSMFCKEVGSNYALKTKLNADFYVAEVGCGANKIE